MLRTSSNERKATSILAKLQQSIDHAIANVNKKVKTASSASAAVKVEVEVEGDALREDFGRLLLEDASQDLVMVAVWGAETHETSGLLLRLCRSTDCASPRTCSMDRILTQKMRKRRRPDSQVKLGFFSRSKSFRRCI